MDITWELLRNAIYLTRSRATESKSALEDQQGIHMHVKWEDDLCTKHLPKANKKIISIVAPIVFEGVAQQQPSNEATHKAVHTGT